MTELNREIHKSTSITEAFNTVHSITIRTSWKKISKVIEGLNTTIN